MKNLENIAEDLFNKIRGRFPSVSLGDENGQVTNITKAARFFDFEYKENDRTLGKVSVTIDEDTLSVMYSTNFVSNEDTMTQNNWYDFLKELRTFSKKRMLNFDTRNITKSNLNKRDYKFLATNRAGEEQMSESTMYGTTKTSFQKIGNAKLSIKHTEAINIESAAARSQKIGKIYIESADGEKFKYPFKHLSGARAMARHVSEGGMPFDDFGVHIVGLSEEMSKLRKFKNYMGRSAVIAESLAGYVDVVKERIATVKKTITSLQKPKFYAETFAAFEKPMMEDVPTDVSDNWIDQLTIKQFNEELADVFPYIYKLVSEATKATELGPEDLDEGIVDWIKSKWQGYQKARADDRKAYDQHLHVMQTILAQNGYDDFSIKRMVNGCLNDPRVCLYNEIREKDLEMGDMDMVVKQVGQSLNKGITSRSATVNDSFDSAADELMGQFGKQYSVVKDEEDTDGDEITLEKDEKTPLGEFILSYFDRESGQFPKGETSVLTMIEKDYGEQYINPGKQFIEAITAKFEELNVPQEPMIDEEPQGTVMEPTVEQDDDLSEDLSQNYENDAEAIKALTAAAGHSPEEFAYLKMLAYKYDFYGKPENIGAAIEKASKAAGAADKAYMSSNRGNVGDPGETPSTPDAPANFPSIEAAMQKVMYYEPGEKANIGGQLHVRDVKDGKKIWRPVKAAPVKAAPAPAAPANPDATDPRGRDQRGESQEQVDIKRLAGL